MRFVTYQARSLRPAAPFPPGLAVRSNVVDLRAAARAHEPPLPRDPMAILRGGEAAADLVREIDAQASDLGGCSVQRLLGKTLDRFLPIGMAKKVWIAPGDVYEIEIGPLGRLTRRLVEELGPAGGNADQQMRRRAHARC
jgi:hypothetical protein